jgi:hypothetical protein
MEKSKNRGVVGMTPKIRHPECRGGDLQFSSNLGHF